MCVYIAFCSTLYDDTNDEAMNKLMWKQEGTETNVKVVYHGTEWEKDKEIDSELNECMVQPYI